MAGAAYHLRQGVSCLRQAPFAALVASLTLAVALAAAGGAFVAGRALEAVLRSYGADARITVFLDHSVTEAEAQRFAPEAARAAGEGAHATFVKPDEALARLKVDLGEAGTALDALVANPLPPSLEIQLAHDRVAHGELTEVRASAARLAALPFAREVDWGEGLLGRLETLLVAVRRLGLALFGIVAIFALFLVGNVVRLTVHQRRDEIEVLRLVGGTDGFVAAPFIVEGALQGLAGGSGGALLVALLERVGWPAVAGSFGFGAALLPEPSIGLLGVVVLAGLVVGVVASTVSVLRFLRALS